MDPNFCNGSVCFNQSAPMMNMKPDDWGFIFKVVVTPIIALIGIVGNCLSFMVMKTRMLREKSYSHYLCALAVFDSLSLIAVQVKTTDELLYYLHKPSLFTYFTDAGCKLYVFTECMCYLMSSWLIVCMAQERLIVVFMPFKKHVLCTQRGAVVIILAIFVIMSYTQMFRLIMVTKIGDKCEGRPELSAIYTSLHVYFYQFALCFILPILIVSICNISVLCKIRSVSRAMADENSSSTRLTRGAARRHKTTMMLLTICFMYITTLLPVITVTMIVFVYLNFYPIHAASVFVNITPWTHVATVVSQINYAANFFIYVVSGKNFRVELRRIFSRERGSNLNSSKTREEIMLL
ncbi:FMRFamide peptide receptor frpr-18-like [Haliotis asinina]|uniref:FMRFamide peptide receptor frpr-18-like n=1 Tax=Haliotis asinina TaxID=109174 RepID=UPI003531926A